jgi:hypothetical protein
MNTNDILPLQRAWQRAVHEHAAFLRDARVARLSANEVHKGSRIHLLRIDTIFSKLKTAEEHDLHLG